MDIGAAREVPVDDLAKIHPVELVAGKDQDQVVGKGAEVDEVAAHRVRRPLVPVQAAFGLLRRQDVHKPAAEGIEIVGVLEMPVERGGVELGQQEDPVDVGIDAIADRDVHEPVFPRERDPRACSVPASQRSEPGAAASPPMITASTRFWVVDHKRVVTVL